MATTTRSKAERRLGVARRTLACLAGLGASAVHAQVPVPVPVLVPESAPAQRWGMELGVSSQLTWTSNSSFGEGVIGTGPASSDTIIELRPRIQLRGNGARLRLSGSASLGGIAYANNTQPGAVEPTADVNARLEAIERLFFLEAGYRASQTSQNPFGVRADASSTTNRLTTSQWRFSPVIEGVAAGDLRYSLRNDNTWAREIGADSAAATGASGYFGRVLASIEQPPRPFGWRIEAERSLTQYDDPAETDLAIATARLRLNYAVGEDWSVGVRGGAERNNADPSLDEWRSIAGVEARWQPSPRTNLSVFREKRFFGSGWDLAFTHRQPRLAWNVGLNRGVDTTPEELFRLPSSDNVAGLIDAMFTTRYPDPVERGRIVQDYIARQGLPNATLGPITLFSQRFSIVTTRRASVSFTGVRNSLTLSGYATRTEDALDSGLLATGLAADNNIQKGAAIVFSHRLTPLASLSTTADWSRIRALEGLLPDESTEHGLRVQITLQAAPLTSTFFGGRYRKLESNVAPEGREGSVYMGLDHRF